MRRDHHVPVDVVPESVLLAPADDVMAELGDPGRDQVAHLVEVAIAQGARQDREPPGASGRPDAELRRLPTRGVAVGPRRHRGRSGRQIRPGRRGPLATKRQEREEPSRQPLRRLAEQRARALRRQDRGGPHQQVRVGVRTIDRIVVALGDLVPKPTMRQDLRHHDAPSAGLGDPLVEAGIVPPRDPRAPGSTPAAGPFPRGFPDQGDRLEGAVGPGNLSAPRAPAQDPPTDAGGRDSAVSQARVAMRERRCERLEASRIDGLIRVEQQDRVGARQPERQVAGDGDPPAGRQWSSSQRENRGECVSIQRSAAPTESHPAHPGRSRSGPCRPPSGGGRSPGSRGCRPRTRRGRPRP